ncbi:MAG: hypothetical protein C4341_09615 [Armatimonadota bacterium]
MERILGRASVSRAAIRIALEVHQILPEDRVPAFRFNRLLDCPRGIRERLIVSRVEKTSASLARSVEKRLGGALRRGIRTNLLSGKTGSPLPHWR